MCYFDCRTLGNEKAKSNIDDRLATIAKQYAAVFDKTIDVETVQSSIVASRIKKTKNQRKDYSNALELSDLAQNAVVSTYNHNSELTIPERVKKVQQVLKGWHGVSASSYEVKVTLNKLLDEHETA